jgi:phosphatidylinositol alpha-1,6-mannosyltransferase
MTLDKLVKLPDRIVGLFPDLLGRGGVQESGRQTVSAITGIARRQNWTSLFLSLNDLQGSQTSSFGNEKIQIEGFARAKMSFVSRCIVEAQKKPRFVLAAHPNLAVVAQLFRWFSPSTKVIVMCHGIEIWRRMPIYRRRALLSADIIVATSRYNVQKLTELQEVPLRKICVLPWPLSPSMLRLADSARKLRLPDNFPPGRVILTVGRWVASERYKGADELIRAVAELRVSFPDLRLALVGGGDDLPRLKRLAAGLTISDEVHFLENLPTEQLAACYAGCEIFALPSTGEGFGLVFLEAMAFRKPVVGASAGGSIDLLQDGENGLVVPGRDSLALGKALSRLLRDAPLGAELGRRGGEIVRRKYRFDVFELGLEGIFLEAGQDSKAVSSI